MERGRSGWDDEAPSGDPARVQEPLSRVFQGEVPIGVRSGAVSTGDTGSDQTSQRQVLDTIREILRIARFRDDLQVVHALADGDTEL